MGDGGWIETQAPKKRTEQSMEDIDKTVPMDTKINIVDNVKGLPIHDTDLRLPTEEIKEDNAHAPMEGVEHSFSDKVQGLPMGSREEGKGLGPMDTVEPMEQEEESCVTV